MLGSNRCVHDYQVWKPVCVFLVWNVYPPFWNMLMHMPLMKQKLESNQFHFRPLNVSDSFWLFCMGVWFYMKAIDRFINKSVSFQKSFQSNCESVNEFVTNEMSREFHVLSLDELLLQRNQTSSSLVSNCSMNKLK